MLFWTKLLFTSTLTFTLIWLYVFKIYSPPDQRGTFYCYCSNGNCWWCCFWCCFNLHSKKNCLPQTSYFLSLVIDAFHISSFHQKQNMSRTHHIYKTILLCSSVSSDLTNLTQLLFFLFSSNNASSFFLCSSWLIGIKLKIYICISLR